MSKNVRWTTYDKDTGEIISIGSCPWVDRDKQRPLGLKEGKVFGLFGNHKTQKISIDELGIRSLIQK